MVANHSELLLKIFVPLEYETLREFYRIKIEEHNSKIGDIYADSGFDLGLPKNFETSLLRQGSVLSDKNFPVHLVKKFRARIAVFDLKCPIIKGEHVVAYTFSNRVPGKITSLEMLISQKTEEVIKVKPKKLLKGNFA